MCKPPGKSGWYWILRFDYASVPEVAFWTGCSFLTIHGNELPPEQISQCGDEPLKPPEDMTS